MSSIFSTLGQKKTANDPPLRQGKWTREEEEYVHCLIDEFKTGMMPLAEGTSLRTFLSKMLNCHPMRISKKFVGSNYNGKQVYARRTGNDRLSNEEVKERRSKLCDLERKFLAKIAPNKPRPPPQHQQPHFMSASGLSGNSGLDLRNLINQAALQSDGVGGGGSNELFRRNSLLAEMPLNDTKASSSSHSLQDLFHELVNSNSSGSLDAFNLMMQNSTSSLGGGGNHFGDSKSSSNKAAAAGRALLQSGLGLDKKPSSSAAPSALESKPLSSFTSAELAAELQKRSSLKDLMAQLGGGGGGGASFQQAADATNANAFSSLMRNSALDMSNLMERQGSIDSLSNLAIRSRLQSMASMGSLLDPFLDGSAGGGASKNANWAANSANLKLNNMAARVSAENLSSKSQRRSASELMESLGVGRVNGLGNGAGSGLHLASLLNNEDALRRLEATAPSSLNQNFSFSQKADGSSNGANRVSLTEGSGSSSSDENTAIQQFLLQKKLMEQGGGDKSNSKSCSTSEQEQLMMNVAAGGRGSGGGMNPIMSSFLSSLKSMDVNDMGGTVGGSSSSAQQQLDDFALKRKFLGSQDIDGLMEQQLMEQQRRNKPFR